MIQAQYEIILIAALTALACSTVGVFLLLRRMSLMYDAISHSILLGIVLAFFITKDLASPLLLLGATLSGLATVALVELLVRSGKLHEDASIGMVFPLLFSLGVIIVSRYAGNIHLDVDSVLVGELVYAPFDRWLVAGWDLGPKSVWVMGSICILVFAFVAAFFKELKLSTFDATLSATLGFSPVLLHYALMSLASITAVGAFNAVGSILVIALAIAPPAAAYLLTDGLLALLILSGGLAVTSAVLGYFAAHLLDTSIAGSIAVCAGLIFTASLMFAPRRGLVMQWFRRRNQRWRFAAYLLLVHLLNHEGTPNEAEECSIDHLSGHFNWQAVQADKALSFALANKYVTQQGKQLKLTTGGREMAKDMLVQT